jgi:DNA processing protein
MMDRDELTAWLRLTRTPGVGNGTARALLTAFGLPDAIFRQSRAVLQQVASSAQATALTTMTPELPALVDATLEWLAQAGPEPDGPARHVVCLGDPRYPSGLLAMEDPPLLLYYLGGPPAPTAAPPAGADAAALGWFTQAFTDSIAIVGSRNPTPQGTDNARQFGKALAEAGLTVVSGMALGVDGAAHAGAIDGVGPQATRAATVAIVGTGLDRVYPKRHLELARTIARRGLIISEYPIGTPPLAANFPMRNRLIAGITRGTLVVEAALKSGSLITARLAVEQGKDVFAIPGSIHSAQSRGCHALIKQGAKLVESAQDVLEEWGWGRVAPESPAAGADPAGDDGVLASLGFDPVGLDALLARTGMDIAHLQARLMALELDGHVARLPGGLFQRMAAA